MTKWPVQKTTIITTRSTTPDNKTKRPFKINYFVVFIVQTNVRNTKNGMLFYEYDKIKSRTHVLLQYKKG